MSAAIPSTTADPPLAARILTNWPKLAEGMLALGLGATTPAAGLPDDHFSGEVLPAIYACGRAMLFALGENRDLTRAEVETFVAPVAERHAEDRFPLSILIEAIHGSAQAVLAAAAALAQPTEINELVAISSRALVLLMHINVVVTESYNDVEHSIYNAERAARRELCLALLRGQPTDELAARAATPVTDQYTVLAIQTVPDDQPGPTADLLARRRMRILHRALETLTNGTGLVTFDGANGIALLPEDADPNSTAALHAAMAADLAEQFGKPVFLANRVTVARADLPGAAEEVAELATLARLLGRPTGLYRIQDLLLEYQLTRPGPSRDQLAGLIAPLLSAPHLLEALEAHLRFGVDRKSASKYLHVHPNTFTYRLSRIGELTGMSPTDPNESRILAASLTIHHMYPPPVVAATQ
ncbi:transcriptional regulator [Nocardia mangyaensis]|uniref:Transcriptional regulator n=2 Tax=Nocardia TaxID=1817 RepID=A0A1J0VYU6_9NOCA|nr:MULTISPECIES: helix-turn-helix domain-containing protein [Nocardia]APE37169.1 transcriptional regulator [Nocardia mangyaensis]